MASCTQVETMLQAWIDNELGHAERVILEQHLAECPACSGVLKQHQRSAALLFESLAEYRLRHNLRRHVLDHLPEMEPSRLRARREAQVQRFAFLRRGLVARLAPLGAVAAVALLSVFLWFQWPQRDTEPQIVGVVTFSKGSVTRQEAQESIPNRAELKDYVALGNLFETAADSRLMLSLRGPTQLKVAEKSQVRVAGERDITVEQGRVWLSVAKSDRPFRILTPTAEVTVLGTILDVNVEAARTVVTVTEGHVAVKNDLAGAEVVAGQQIELKKGEVGFNAHAVEPFVETRWAESITPDGAATELFLTAVQIKGATPLRAEQVFVVRANAGTATKTVPSFVVTWPLDKTPGDRCSYTIHVYNDAMVELFRTYIDGSVFDNSEEHSRVIQVPGGPISNVDVIHIKVVPDFSTGTKETPLDISALSV